MKQMIGIAFLVVGIILLCAANHSYHSAASDVSRVVTGTSTDKTLWLVVGGVLGTLIGVGGLLTGSKKNLVLGAPGNIARSMPLTKACPRRENPIPPAAGEGFGDGAFE
jgi:hypothetical protein